MPRSTVTAPSCFRGRQNWEISMQTQFSTTDVYVLIEATQSYSLHLSRSNEERRRGQPHLPVVRSSSSSNSACKTLTTKNKHSKHRRWRRSQDLILLPIKNLAAPVLRLHRSLRPCRGSFGAR
ncbi:hypothetical protein AKJ16_DCAP19863 [Drosera capensis]